MKLILDTHAIIWWDVNPDHIGSKAMELISDPANDLFVSVASLWEMQIKSKLGKLALPLPMGRFLERQQIENGIIVLQITAAHVLKLESLPPIHNDPFDRMLICQAVCENALLLTADKLIPAYNVKTAW